jgi:hypothetical protein
MGPWQLVARRALRVGMAVAWVCAATAIGVASAVARPRLVVTAAASCSPRLQGVTAQTGRVIVDAQDDGIDSFSGGSLTAYYACLRPNGRPMWIGESETSGGEYPPNVEMQHLRIAGTFVADESAAGFASAAACSKSEPASQCNNIVKWWVAIADVATRRRVKVFVSGPVSSLALSPAGAAAWVLPTPASGSSSSSSSSTSTLYAIVVHRAGHDSLSGRRVVVDSGQAISSVSFAGSTLRWSNGGHRKSKTIS